MTVLQCVIEKLLSGRQPRRNEVCHIELCTFEAARQAEQSTPICGTSYSLHSSSTRSLISVDVTTVISCSKHLGVYACTHGGA